MGGHWLKPSAATDWRLERHLNYTFSPVVLLCCRGGPNGIWPTVWRRSTRPFQEFCSIFTRLYSHSEGKRVTIYFIGVRLEIELLNILWPYRLRSILFTVQFDCIFWNSFDNYRNNNGKQNNFVLRLTIHEKEREYVRERQLYVMHRRWKGTKVYKTVWSKTRLASYFWMGQSPPLQFSRTGWYSGLAWPAGIVVRIEWYERERESYIEYWERGWSKERGPLVTRSSSLQLTTRFVCKLAWVNKSCLWLEYLLPACLLAKGIISIHCTLLYRWLALFPLLDVSPSPNTISGRKAFSYGIEGSRLQYSFWLVFLARLLLHIRHVVH